MFHSSITYLIICVKSVDCDASLQPADINLVSKMLLFLTEMTDKTVKTTKDITQTHTLVLPV